MKLTCAERLTLAALREFHGAHGYMPTVKQLTSACGWKSLGCARRYLRSLNDKGAIRYRPHTLQVTLC